MNKNRKLKTLTHFLTRDAPLIAIEAWYNGRMYKFTKYTGIHYPATLFMHENGSFKFYIDNAGFNEKLPRDLSVWINSHKKKFMKIHGMMRNSLAKIKEIKTFSFETEKELLNGVRKITALWSDVYIGVLISHHLAMFHEKFMENGIRLYHDRIVDEAVEWRKEAGNVFFNEGVEAINTILYKIAKLKKSDSEALRHMTFKELEAFIKTGELLKKINLRKNSTYAYFKDRVIDGKEVGVFLTRLGFKLNKEENLKNIREIKGSVANLGSAIGTARIITNRTQLKKFKQDDIIIAHMTSPWYVPIMQKAAAIVTDEGGITCHAAIIARELNKPCIIGTKYATKILKDGDILELDTNKGLVKILSKSK